MLEAHDLFDPDHYASVRRPLLDATTLPSWCYTSDAFHQREIERIFAEVWNFVGHVDQIREPGDYFVVDLCGESIIMIRDKAEQVHAFANTCRHRGTRLLNRAGHCRVVSCPYHSWTFALDGALIATPGMEQTQDFDPSENALIELALETWQGFMFVHLGEPTMPLAEYLGNLPDKLASYEFANMTCVRRQEFDIACNWKLYIENALEDYHTPTVHRGSLGEQLTVREDSHGAWDAIHMESDVTVAVLPEDNSPFPHIGSLQGRAAKGTYFVVIYPSTVIACTQDCMWWVQLLPQGPGGSKLITVPCFPRDTANRDDFEQQVQKYYFRWDKGLGEDIAICEAQHAGIHSRYSRPGRLSYREPIVHAIDNWILDRVL